MIVFRILRGRWSPILAKEFRRTRRPKPVLLLARLPNPLGSDGEYHDDYGPWQLRVHCERWSRRRPRRCASSRRPAHRGVRLKRDGLMRCVSIKRGQYELQELDTSRSTRHRHSRTNRNGKPLASAAAHFQLRRGACYVFPF
ncbi:MAG: hypothetical protein SHS37scaffold296_21 [Burkholderiales phage 68_11]|jgi:hypothetical protein|nr:MAG: hypothetical protein SHS37scaffold296_21 [Burkholderiales phage 68_11]